MSAIKGLIKQRYPNLKGSDWIKRISPEDRDALLHKVRAAGQHGRAGGKARAAKATRDHRGRFASKGCAMLARLLSAIRSPWADVTQPRKELEEYIKTLERMSQ